MEIHQSSDQRDEAFRAVNSLYEVLPSNIHGRLGNMWLLHIPMDLGRSITIRTRAMPSLTISIVTVFRNTKTSSETLQHCPPHALNEATSGIERAVRGGWWAGSLGQDDYYGIIHWSSCKEEYCNTYSRLDNTKRLMSILHQKSRPPPEDSLSRELFIVEPFFEGHE